MTAGSQPSSRAAWSQQDAVRRLTGRGYREKPDDLQWPALRSDTSRESLMKWRTSHMCLVGCVKGQP